VEYVVVGRIAGDGDPPGPALLIAYTQTSFWNLYERSQPLYDTNYQPEGYVSLPVGDGRAELSAGLRHRSNGRGGAGSRSFQNTFARFSAPLESGSGFVALEAWAVWDKPDNPDIADYTGYGQVEAYWRRPAPLRSVGRDPSLSVRLPLGGRTFIPAVEVTLAFGMGPAGARSVLSPRIALQYYEGYAQNLTDYRDRTSSWRLGIVFAE
jgi:phospholipase A1